MKKRVLLCLVLLAAVFFTVSAEKLYYRETTGKDREMYATFTVDRTASGYRIALREVENGLAVDQTYEIDECMATLSWTYRDEAKETVLTGSRRGGIITMSGTHLGKPIHKEFDAGALPWNQLFTMGLRQFILSGEEEYRFWTIGTQPPGDMLFAEFKAVREGVETISVNGRETRAIKATIKLTGLRSMLWHADCWFRQEDGLYLRFETNKGPLAPLTVAELIEEGE